MTLFEQVKRIERIDHLIRNKSTGTPAQLAEKVGLSISQLYTMIRMMKKDFKAPIYYSKVDRNYYYVKNVKFICSFRPEKESFFS